jgi:hypothetical protein
MKKFLSYTVYWLLQCTWGFIMTFIGAIAALGLIIAGHKPKTMGPTVYFEVGENWGGVELGGFFLCCKNAGEHTKFHECGHGLQNIIWGPLMPFVVCIPSAARYWLFNFKTPIARAIYISCLMIAAILLTTSGACIFALIGGFKIIVILFEIIRLYFLSLVIWLNVFQLPQFHDGKQPTYNDVWFEDQATRWGTALYEKKED